MDLHFVMKYVMCFIYRVYLIKLGYAIAHLVEALRYTLEGRWVDWNFSLT